MRFNLIFVLIVCFSITCSGQLNNFRRPWMYGNYPNNLSFTNYRVINVEGMSLEDVWNKSRLKLIYNLAAEKDPEVSTSNSLDIESEDITINGKMTEGRSIDRSKLVIDIKFKNFSFSYNLADEYYTYNQGKYQYWGLFEVAENGKPLTLKPIEYTTDYGLEPVWRSAIIPGWGQFYKKKTVRGIAFFASEAVLISTTIYCESMRADNIRKSEETLNIDVVKEYRKRADTWELKRNVAIGGAIAVYALNLLDAAKGKGQIKYAFLSGNVDLLAYKEGEINQFGLKITF